MIGFIYRSALVHSIKCVWYNNGSHNWNKFYNEYCVISRIFKVKTLLHQCLIDFFIRTFYSSGLRRSIKCVYKAFHARSFVKKHQLLLDHAAHHGGIGVALPEQLKSGIPKGCGFEYPVQSIVFVISLLGFMYSTKFYQDKI